VSLAWSVHISWLFGELPYLERVGAARRAGFARIETAWPEQADREGLARAVAESGVEVVLLNCPAGDARGGERGFINDPSRREEAELGFLAAAELAERIGARNLNLLVGRALPGVGLARQRESLLGALRGRRAGPTAGRLPPGLRGDRAARGDRPLRRAHRPRPGLRLARAGRAGQWVARPVEHPRAARRVRL
jgi:hypothetical protein